MRTIKKYIVIGIIAFLLILSAVTNPKEADYESFIKNQIENQSNNNVLVSSIANLIAGPVLQSSTKVDNYIFFSVFSTSIANNNVTFIGVFDNFIPIKQVSNTTSNESSNQPASAQTTSTSESTQPSPSMTYTTENGGTELTLYFHSLGSYSPTKLAMIVPGYSGNNDFADMNNLSNLGIGWQIFNGNIDYSFPNADWGANIIIKVLCTAPGKNPITLSFSYNVPNPK